MTISQKRNESRRSGREPRGIVVRIALLAACCAAGCNLSGGVHQRTDQSSRLTETAAFISGLDIPASSPFNYLAAKNDYLAYKKRMDGAWSSFVKNDLSRIEVWRGRNLGLKKYRTLFYPFSGPDIVNALAFFPDADEYILIGLEPPGRVPEPLAMGPDRVFTELRALRTALNTLLNLNYFRTLEMKLELNENGFNNISCIMIFFISRSGYRIVDVRNISLPRSDTDRGGTGAGTVRGVEISFSKNSFSGNKKAYYFTANLSDKGLNASRFADYLKRRAHFVTFMKSAAYLPGLNSFSTIRGLILANSDYILHDDSCIPIRFFPERDWETTYFGKYRVLKMFRKWYQPDLAAKMKEKNAGPLDFSFGYGYTPEESHLIFSRRR